MRANCAVVISDGTVPRLLIGMNLLSGCGAPPSPKQFGDELGELALPRRVQLGPEGWQRGRWGRAGWEGEWRRWRLVHGDPPRGGGAGAPV